MQFEISNIECPECHGTNTVRYILRFSGTLYGCADCETTFKQEQTNAPQDDLNIGNNAAA